MFSFFDNQKKPFLSMMNAENPASDESVDMSLTNFVQQGLKLQMQLMQAMWMMPFTMMQGTANALGRLTDGASAEKAASGEAGGFKLGKLEVPPELLEKLLNLEMSPEKLEKLQQTLDTVFAAMPKAKKKNED